MKRWVVVSLLLEKGLRLAGWFEFCKRTSQDNDAMYRKRRGKTKEIETKKFKKKKINNDPKNGRKKKRKKGRNALTSILTIHPPLPTFLLLLCLQYPLSTVPAPPMAFSF